MVIIIIFISLGDGGGGLVIMLKLLLVALVKLPDVATSVYPFPVLLIDNVENVAMPATAAMTLLPESVPDPGLLPIANVIVAVLLNSAPN